MALFSRLSITNSSAGTGSGDGVAFVRSIVSGFSVSRTCDDLSLSYTSLSCAVRRVTGDYSRNVTISIATKIAIATAYLLDFP